MSDTINIYGQKVELTPPGDGYITDVIILARSLRHGDDGKMYDALLVSATESTTGMLFDGMIQALNGETEDTE